MKKLTLSLLALAASLLTVCAQQNSNKTAIPHEEIIALTAPDMTLETTLMQALKDRASIGRGQTFSQELPSLETLSSLLWAANGFNREDKRTAPSAINAQDIDIYVCFEFDTYLYDAKQSQLKRVNDKDIRGEFSGPRGGETPAPIILVLVSDFSRYFIKDENDRKRMAHSDASFVSANIGLYCAAAGLATRPRMGANWEKIAELLNLAETQHGILNNPVGFVANGE